MATVYAPPVPAQRAPPPLAADYAERFLHPWRPWLDFYSRRVRAAAGGRTSQLTALASGGDDLAEHEPAPIQRLLSEELLAEVLKHASGADVARCACVCREWRYGTLRPTLWRSLCADAWPMETEAQLEALCAAKYRSSYRHMYTARPRLRFDGIYCSRNQYLKTGVREWQHKGGVHVVVYYRYYRFFPDGTFVTKTSASNLSAVKGELARPLTISRGGADGAGSSGGGRRRRSKQQQTTRGVSVFGGIYMFDERTSKVRIAITYESERPTVCRQRLRLRSTVRGANNRLDFIKIVTSAADELDSSDEDEGDGADEAAQQPLWALSPEQIPRISHTKVRARAAARVLIVSAKSGRVAARAPGS